MPDRTTQPLRSSRPPTGLRPAALALAAAFGAVSPLALAQTLPSGGVAVHGQAAISQPAPNQLRVVTQNGAGTNHSAINWQSFSISAGSTATIVQPSTTSLSINRVVTNTPSAIFGNLSSNGRLVLVNQSGIAVGAGAVIDTAGFTASTLRMTDADALAGRLRFGEPGASMGGAGGLTVGGRITARDGDIVLVAPNVDLGASALLQAPNGSTILAAGQQVEITGRGLEGITMLVQAPTDQARNLGRLEGSAVGIFAGTLRHSGEIQATTATLEGGTVVLKAAGDAIVDGSAAITATGVRGGSVDILGRRVAVTDQALVDVSGAQGGGSIRMGGDYQGKNPEVPTALRTYLGPQAQLRADALESGNGGRIIVWGDEVTRAYGTLSAHGGPVAGNGGFAEVSGKHGLVFEAAVDLHADAGSAGTLLLDPDFITIVVGGSDPVTSGDQFGDTPSSVSISPLALISVLGNVLLQSDGDITFSSGFSFATAGKSLTALAGNAIRVDASITTNGGAITLHSAAPGAAGTGSTDSDAVYVNAPITSGGGTIILRADSCDLGCTSVAINAPVNAGAGTIVLLGAGDVLQTGTGTLAAAVLQATAEGVIDLNLTGNNISSDVSLITNTLTAGTSLVQFHNAQSFLLNNAVAKGNVTIAGAGSVTTDGSVTSSAGNVSISSFNGISLGDDVTAPGSVSLSASGGNIVQTAGSILVGGATSVIAGAGDIGLTQSTNNFASVALTGSNISVRDSTGLTVSSLTRNGTNKSLTLIADGGALSLPAGNIDVGIAQIDLRGTGVLSTPGALSGGSILLNGTGGILLTNNVTINGGLLELTAGTGSILQSGGQISAPSGIQTVFNAAGVNVNLSAGGNDFGQILGATGSLTLVDANSITVSSLGGGISSNVGDIILSATGIGSITLQGNVNAGTGDVTMNTRGLTQTGGVVTANTLTVNSSLGSISLPASNNVAAARLSGSGASTIDLNNVRANYALSGTGGTLTVTGGGHVTVDQALNFASGIDITSTGGITLAANVTPGANLSLSASTGLIEQTAGTLFANSGTATINAGGGDIALTSATNQFNVANLSGGHITVVASNGLIVNSLSSGLGQNVFLDAGAGDLLLPATPINAGTGQITLTSGGPLFLAGALTGSDILLSSSTGLTIANNITASGFLNMGSTTGGVSQNPGTSIAVAGITSVGAGGADISLAQPGNNFSTVEATGRAITLRDATGLNLGATNAGTSLDVLANGNVTQTAPVLVSGTTAIAAGSGNVTLASAGNNLNVLSVSGNAINVVEGAGSNLTVTSLSSGTNQPVSLSAGHTLTLPSTAILAGTGDITLTSNIGPLVIPQSLAGNNISLSGAGGLTVNGTVNAIGNFNASVSGNVVSTINQDVISGGSMVVAMAGGLELPAVNQTARLSAGTGQTISARYLALTVTGSGASQISNSAGTQSITTTGQSATGEGILVRNAGTGANTASILNNNVGPQTITVNDAAAVRVQGISGDAEIGSIGSQTVLIRGASSANVLEIGAAGAARDSEIWGSNQSITVGQTGQSGSIVIRGSTQDDTSAGLGNNSGGQLVKATGIIELHGGSAPGVGVDCVATSGAHGGSCAFIASNTGNQTVSGGDIRLFGGTSGSLNTAVIANFAATGSQQLELTGGGDLVLTAGGGSGTGNRAVVTAAGNSQTVNFLAGGDLTMAGGTVGTAHRAQLLMTKTTGTQTISGATGITLTAGASGGGSNVGNRALIASSGSQVISAGSGGITLTGGGGTGLETDNDAQIFQSGTTGTSQTITITGGGSINLTGGSSALVNVGGSGHGSRALIEADGDSQSIHFSAGGAINLTGGTNGSRAFAVIESLNGSQSITGAPDITLVAGASGGFAGEGNRARINADVGAQTIVASDILMQGGAGGVQNAANIFGGGGQTITATGLTMLGGAGGGGLGDGNRAYLFTGANASQLINLGAGGLHMAGGGGSLSDNSAQLEQIGTGTQTININNGALVLTGGSSALQNVGGSGHGSRASIYSEGATQTITMSGTDRSITLTGGTVGSRNFAQIFAENTGNQVISGASSITLTGGSSGGVSGEGNSAYIVANAGSQSISATSITLNGGAGGVDNFAQIHEGAVGGTQAITIGSGGAISLQGGGGTNNFARIRALGTGQTLGYTSGGSLFLTGGTGASLNYARVESVNGSQTITGAPSIALTGGASGGASLNGNFASIQASATGAVQTIASSGMTLSAGAGGTNNFAFVGASVIDLTVNGNLAMNGGGSAPSLDGTQGGGARIGAPNTEATDLTLAVTGSLIMTGGSVSGVAIGSGISGGVLTDLDITVGGSVSLNPGTSPTAGARIGSPSSNIGGGDISVVAGGSISLNTNVGSETGVLTNGHVKLAGNLLSIADTVTGQQIELEGQAGVNLSGHASILSNGTGDAIKVKVNTGGFSNTAAVDPLIAPNGRWLVYSVNPANDTRGSLAYDFKQYDAVPGDTILGIGNGLLYSLAAPTASASLIGTVSKTYDGNQNATLAPGNYSVTGIDGDVITLNNPVSGTYDTKTFGSGKLVTSGSLSIVTMVDANGKPVFGYNPVVAPATGLVGSIGAATITAITGVTAVDKVYDTTTAATLVTTGAVFAGMAPGDTLTIPGAIGTFDTKDVGPAKTVTVTGLTLSGADSGNYTLSATSATATAAITPATISAVTGITAANKVYDGTTTATLTTTGAAFTGRLGSDVLNVATAVGNFSDKNVANPKTVDVTGLSLGGPAAGNYVLTSTTATTAAAITPATITAVGGITASKVYDGTTTGTAVTSGATFTGAVPGDNLTVSVASATFADKNVGTGKVLTASGLTLGGTDQGNYSFAVVTSTGTGVITQRPLSTWTGAGGDGLWANPLNWDAIPDLSNVAAVSIPAGPGSVLFDSSVGTTNLQTISSLRPLGMSSGNLAVSSTLAAEDFSQSGGALSGAGHLIATNSFAQSGGSIAMGSLTLVQNSGNLSFTNLSGTTVALVAPAGAISQSGPLVAGTLTSSSQNGTTLTNGGNQISNLFAENLGTGAISIGSTGPMNVVGLDNVGGDITVSTAGAMSVFGPVTSASGSVSLAATGASGNLGLFAPVTAGNQVVLAAAQTLTQDAAVTGTNGVTADAGVAMVFGTFATANYAPVVYRVNGLAVNAPPTALALPAAADEQVDPLVTFVELLGELVDPPPDNSDFTPDGKRKDKADDTIVAEGEVCK